MTHEDRGRPEHTHGPEHDPTLPHAIDIPVYDNVADSCAPPLIDVTPHEQLPGTEYVGAAPGWWDDAVNPDAARSFFPPGNDRTFGGMGGPIPEGRED